MPSDLTAEKIAELKRLWAAATPGEWVGELHDLHDGFIDDKGYVRLETPVSEMVGYAKVQDVVFAAALHNAFPELIAALEAATAERDAYKRQCDSLVADIYAEAETQMARDARMKAEGAIEILERLAGKVGHQYTGTRRYSTPDLLREAAELRLKERK